MKGRIWFVGIILLMALLVTACGPGGGQGGGQQGGTGGGAGTVTVSEKEWTITFPSSTIKAGRLSNPRRHQVSRMATPRASRK